MGGYLRISYCFFLLIHVLHAHSQADTRKKQEFYGEVGVFVGPGSVNEGKLSSLTYSGTLPGVFFGVKADFPHAEHHLNIRFSKGNLETDNPVSSSMNESLITIGYYNLFSLFKTEGNLFSIQAGAAFQYLYNQRFFEGFINSGNSFESITSFGATVKLTYRFGREPGAFSLSDRFTFPFLFYYTQPDYTGIQDEVTVTGPPDQNSHFSGISEVLMYGNEFSMAKPVSDKSEISVIYNWDYYHIYSLRELRYNGQQIGLKFSYKF